MCHRLSGLRLALPVVAAMLLSSASYAASEGHSRVHVGGFGDGGDRYSESYSNYPYSTPQDYSSSHVCINGYRWITRRLSPNDTPEQNAIPVPCH